MVMKAIASQSNVTQTVTATKHQAEHHKRVLDKHNHPIPGLYQRGDRFYGRIEVAGANEQKRTRWFPLFNDEKQQEPCSDVKEARDALGVLRSTNSNGNLKLQGKAPLFTDYVEDYFKHHEELRKAMEQKRATDPKNATLAKRESTIMRERGPLDLWKEHLAGLRLHKIGKRHIQSFIEKRQKAGMTGRTCNYDVIVLRNVLKRALDAELITELPTKNFRPIKHTAPKRGLVTAAEITRLCEKALEVSKNWEQFGDYIRLMSYCGSRRDETLRLKWSDVDWKNNQLVVGSDGQTKNGLPRAVDFNPKLEGHLKDMKSRKAPDTDWMFPSPQRGEKDIPAKSFRETLEAARAAAKLPRFGFHDCRHHFISMCVMSGIDYMTIAEWVGHQDGGILIGKVYGHLADQHKKAQAQKVNFEPVVLEKTA